MILHVKGLEHKYCLVHRKGSTSMAIINHKQFYKFFFCKFSQTLVLAIIVYDQLLSIEILPLRFAFILNASANTYGSQFISPVRYLANVNSAVARHSSQTFKTRAVHQLWQCTECSVVLLLSNNILVFLKNMVPLPVPMQAPHKANQNRHNLCHQGT